MNELLANPVVVTILPPLLAGLLLGVLAWVSSGNRIAMALGWGIGLLFIYWLLEGVPPLPPIAAKQKLGYLLALGGLAGFALIAWRFSPLISRLKYIALAALAVISLGWSKFGGADDLWVLLLAIAVSGLLSAGSIAAMSLTDSQTPQAAVERTFIIPTAYLTTAIAGSIVAASGLFLGMAQMLGALAAMLGGAIAVGFFALLARGRGIDLLPQGAAMAVANALLCAVALTALLAPSANGLALVLLSLGPLLAALLANRLAMALPGIALFRPILAGAIIAVPAIIASLIAVFTGTSPFA